MSQNQFLLRTDSKQHPRGKEVFQNLKMSQSEYKNITHNLTKLIHERRSFHALSSEEKKRDAPTEFKTPKNHSVSKVNLKY